ncbi:hypothetical protein LUX33_48855 [Actinomadura madurae]|uniref:hypothetical protein n=1 Tax=Actinomadura madurae TaxID=1993 RepID=UPI0020D20A61|nr:hypothetical protein [Actinomadura madurae]MCP9955488.1 hypothetical protein [Actinomadura madurae]
MSNIDIVKAFLDGLHKPISQVPDHLRASLAEDAEWGNSGFPRRRRHRGHRQQAQGEPAGLRRLRDGGPAAQHRRRR